MENCNNYQERISAFIDGLLTEEERLELMEHMAACPACQQYLDDQIAIHDALTGLEADAPAGFTDAVMTRVRETKQDAPEKKAIAFPHWRRWLATAACCAVAVLGVMSLGGRNELGPAVSQDIASYDMARTQEKTAVSGEAATADDKPVAYTTQSSEPFVQAETAPTDGVAACSLDGDTELYVQTAASPPVADLSQEEADAESKENAEFAVLTTASPLAVQWVEDHLGQPWQPGSSYALTAEQFDELRGLLDDAGEPYTAETTENGGFLLLAES